MLGAQTLDMKAENLQKAVKILLENEITAEDIVKKSMGCQKMFFWI